MEIPKLPATVATRALSSSLFAVLSISVLVGFACSGEVSGGSPKEPGGVGAACRPGGACSAGLRCEVGICVEKASSEREGAVCSPDVACLDGLSCKEGICCNLENTVCDNHCVDTRANALHCGGCGNACQSSEACIDSECQEYCEGAACVTGGKRFVGVAAGGMHSCGILMSSKKVVCWGSNADGQAPTAPSAASFQAISAGKHHTCGVRDDDKIVCWGRNTEGQAPTTPSTELFWAVTAGEEHSCGLRQDSKVVCWGRNAEGQAPTSPSQDSFESVSAGGNHTCGITEEGAVVCWGSDSEGQSKAPDGQFRSVGAGYDHTCAVGGVGLVCWGTDKTARPPLEPAIYTGYGSIQAGLNSTCYYVYHDAPYNAGNIGCFGNLARPPSVGASDDYFKSYSVGSSHACAITYGWGDDADRVVCWGNDAEGQAPGWVPP